MTRNLLQIVHILNGIFVSKGYFSIDSLTFFTVMFPKLVRYFKIPVLFPDAINFFRDVTFQIIEERKKTGQVKKCLHINYQIMYLSVKADLVKYICKLYLFESISNYIQYPYNVVLLFTINFK